MPLPLRRFATLCPLRGHGLHGCANRRFATSAPSCPQGGMCKKIWSPSAYKSSIWLPSAYKSKICMSTQSLQIFDLIAFGLQVQKEDLIAMQPMPVPPFLPMPLLGQSGARARRGQRGWPKVNAKLTSAKRSFARRFDATGGAFAQAFYKKSCLQIFLHIQIVDL